MPSRLIRRAAFLAVVFALFFASSVRLTAPARASVADCFPLCTINAYCLECEVFSAMLSNSLIKDRVPDGVTVVDISGLPEVQYPKFEMMYDDKVIQLTMPRAVGEGGFGEPIKRCYHQLEAGSPIYDSFGPADRNCQDKDSGWIYKDSTTGKYTLYLPDGTEVCKDNGATGDAILTLTDGSKATITETSFTHGPNSVEETTTGGLRKVTRKTNGLATSHTYTYTVEDGTPVAIRRRVTTVTFNSDHTYDATTNPSGVKSLRISTMMNVYYPGNHSDVDLRGRLYFTVPAEGVKRYLEANGYAKGVDPNSPGAATTLDNTTTVTDAALKAYATQIYLDYDDKGRILQMTGDPSCGPCGGGGGTAGTTTYAYGTNSNYPAEPTEEQISNTWKTYKRIIERNGLHRVEFYNVNLQTIFSVTQVTEGGTRKHWVNHSKYDTSQNLSERRSPSACTGYTVTTDAMDDHWPTDVTAVDTGTAGFVQHWTYNGNDNLTHEKISQGAAGTKYLVRKYTYKTIAKKVRSGRNETNPTYHLASRTEYPTAGTDESAADRLITKYDYKFYQADSEDTNAIQFRRVTYPAVSTANNGSGTALTMTQHFYRSIADDQYYNDWTKYEDGTLSYTKQRLSDQNTQFSIVDAKTDGSGNLHGETGITAPNDPWSSGVWTSTSGLHRKTSFTYDDWARQSTVTDPAGRKSMVAYMSQHETASGKETTTALVTLSTAHMDGDDDYDHVPVSISVSDMDGKGIESAAGLPTTDEDGNLANDWDRTESHIAAAFNGTLTRRSKSTYNTLGQLRFTDAYHNIPGSGDGAIATNFYRTTYTHDTDTGRLYKTEHSDGTIEWTEVDLFNREKETWRGTDSAAASLGDLPAGNMKLISRNYFDDGNDTTEYNVGDQNVTMVRSYHSGVAGGGSYYQIDATFDWRSRRTGARDDSKVAIKSSFDNLDRVTLSETYYDSDENFTIGGAELRGKSESSYDELGRVFKTIEYEVSDTGTVGHSTTSKQWRDSRGRMIKTEGTNGLFTKISYDSMGRVNATYQSYDDDETAFADADDVTGDTVIEQSKNIYNDEDELVVITLFEREHDDTTTTGALTTTNSFYTVHANWYDEVGRETHQADYGRDGSESGGTRYIYDASGNLKDSDSDGIPDEAEGTPREPNTSDDFIVSKTEYNSEGEGYKFTDNLGKISQSEFDDLGRLTKSVENHINGGASETETDTDRVTEIQYDSAGRRSKRIAKNPKGSGNGVEDQTTTYLYESDFEGSWVTSVIYPDSTDTTSASTDQFKTTYDRLGRVKTQTDQNGNVHTMVYDSQGRLEQDQVTTLGANIDGTVRRIHLTLDHLDRTTEVTSYDAVTGGNVVNEIEYEYSNTAGDWNSLLKSYKSHSGAVNTSTTPKMQYAYDDGAISGAAKYLRPTSVTYPGPTTATQLHYNYVSTGVGAKTNQIANLANDASGTTKYAQYSYLGAGNIIKSERPAVTNGLTLNYDPDNDNTYKGTDRFGRLIQQQWKNGSSVRDEFAYGYDRIGSRLYKDIPSTLYATDDKDHLYSHDNLHRLDTFKRGTLNGTQTAITGTAEKDETYALDVIGNWRTYVSKTNGTTNLSQTRTHNMVNEVSAIAETTGPSWVDPTFDANGNMTEGPKGDDETTRLHYIYDAWDRLVEVKDDNAGSPGNAIAKYRYDGLNRRIRKFVKNGSTWDIHEYYYNESWRCLEERLSTGVSLSGEPAVATAVYKQHVWDLSYIDAAVCRLRDTDANGSLDETLYYTNDVQFNVTALINTSGTVVERYDYDPYGRPTVLDADFSDDSDGISDYDNEVTYTGQRLDSETGQYHFRNRQYSYALSQFTSRDAQGYVDGSSLYGSYFAAGSATDPMGFGIFDSAEERRNQALAQKMYAKIKMGDIWIKAIISNMGKRAAELGTEEIEQDSYYVRTSRERLQARSGYVVRFHDAVSRSDSSSLFELAFEIGTAVPGTKLSEMTQQNLRSLAASNNRIRSAIQARVQQLNSIISTLEDIQTGVEIAQMVAGGGAVAVLFKAGFKAGAIKICATIVKGAAVQGAAALSKAALRRMGVSEGVLAAIDLGVAVYQIMAARRPQCFPAGTLVWTKDGPKKIEDVEAGEWVWSYNHDSKQWELCRVTRTFKNDYDGLMVDITIEMTNSDRETITSTGGHPFWVVNRQGREGRPRVTYSDQDNERPVGHWTQAKHLRLGDVFLLKNGKSATITGYRVRREQLKVYNLDVESLHNFAVGGAAVLVHNACGKRGKTAHQDKVKEIEDRMKADGFEHKAGGSLPERKTATLGGNKNSRFADLEFESPNGQKIAVQVGKRNKTNSRPPVSRERKAIADLKGSGEFDSIQFVEY